MFQIIYWNHLQRSDLSTHNNTGGCTHRRYSDSVEAHEQDEKGSTKNLQADDPKGVKVYCDAGVPSFNPIDYDANKLDWTGEPQKPPVVRPPEAPETKTPETPKTKAPEIKCPTEVQLLETPVGTLTDAGKKKIVEYRIVEKQCVAIKADLEIPDQIIKAIPSAGQVTTTAFGCCHRNCCGNCNTILAESC